ncbi:hypothetical protein [Caulobacter sp. 17J80-11]|uniref:hypothetical protein n=1 Tax=Caulobacter sp. 17J80-11 TaxID=2763502 RepID=UPI00165363D4|nr:hypothetical protein [Caulobacter sp. 17J80-11]MBC6980389.1 hypothetical protein [Caulobacter sp. 17J80-11]
MAFAADPELEALAEEEMARALTLSWREASKVTPWGDTYTGFAPSGGEVHFERSYIWADREGGDVQVEVVVYDDPERYDEAARRTGVIRRGD